MRVSQWSGIEFLLTDQVGTLRAVADTSGAIVKRIDYDSFGNIIADSNPVFSVPFGFAGGLHDRDTGLVRFGYRDYSPELGRFTAKDPIDFAGGDTNLYAYVMNDPINFTDPSGLVNKGKLLTGGLSVFDGMAMIGTGIAATGLTGAATRNPYLTAVVGAEMIPVFAGGVMDILHGAHECWEGLMEDDSPKLPTDTLKCH